MSVGRSHEARASGRAGISGGGARVASSPGWPLCGQLEDALAADTRLTRAVRDVYRTLLRHAWHTVPAHAGANFDLVRRLVRAGQIASRLSYRTLARYAHCSLSTVQRALRVLASLGYIRPLVTRSRTVSVYSVGRLVEGGRRFFGTSKTYALGPYGEPLDATPRRERVPRASAEAIEVLKLANTLHAEHHGVRDFHTVDPSLVAQVEATLARVGFTKLCHALRGAWKDRWLVENGLAGPHYLCLPRSAARNHLDGAAARWLAYQHVELEKAKARPPSLSRRENRPPSRPQTKLKSRPRIEAQVAQADADAQAALERAAVDRFLRQARHDAHAAERLRRLETLAEAEVRAAPIELPEAFVSEGGVQPKTSVTD